MLHPGDTLGDYEIVAGLKSGGMATLFLARRRGAAGFAREVAIKLVHPQLAGDARFTRMLVEEAKLAARIHHPNVVHVEELGEHGGTYFVAMEYVHGASLADLLARLSRHGYRLAPEICAWITIQIADGLHAAHETTDDRGAPLGVVHRDVSPQNVLLSFTGQVKLIDFGIAKARGREASTRAGSLKGKIGYMSPEQAYGRALDRRTDVYALGLVTWELLAMRRAFDDDDDMALLETVRDPALTPPSHFNPAVPPALDAAVMAALAPDRDARLLSAQQFRQHVAAAMPAALSVEASQLASIVLATCSESAMTNSRERTEANLQTLVASALERHSVTYEDEPDGAAGEASRRSVDDALSALLLARGATRSDPGEPAAHAPSSASDAAATPAPRAHSRVRRVLIAAIALTLSTLLAVGLARNLRTTPSPAALAPTPPRTPASPPMRGAPRPVPTAAPPPIATQPIAPIAPPRAAPATASHEHARRGRRGRRRPRNANYLEGLPLLNGAY